MSLRLDLSLFRRGDVAQALFDQDSTFLQLQRNSRVLVILNQQSLPQSECRGPFNCLLKLVAVRLKIGNHVQVAITW
jgi:hypothetical protein